MNESPQYTFEEVGKGVWAAIAKPGSGAHGNSGIVDIGRSTLVFDTSMTPTAASELRVAARILSGKEPLEVVNSHWHLGHAIGNRVFGGCTIRGTETTRRMMERFGAGLAEQVGDPVWARLTDELAHRRDIEGRALYRHELSEQVNTRRDLADGRGSIAVRPPDETLAERYVYPGGRDVMLVAGAGHSESDTILWVPEEEVMFTGDLVVAHTHPDLRSSDLPRWSEALRRIANGRPRVVVPGHGPVAGPEPVGEVAEYLGRMQDWSTDESAVELPEEYRSWASPSLFPANLRRVRELRGDR